MILDILINRIHNLVALVLIAVPLAALVYGACFIGLSEVLLRGGAANLDWKIRKKGSNGGANWKGEFIRPKHQRVPNYRCE